MTPRRHHHAHGHGHGCCHDRAYCEACSDEAAEALGQLVIGPLVALGTLVGAAGRATVRRPLAALALLVVALIALAVAGVVS